MTTRDHIIGMLCANVIPRINYATIDSHDTRWNLRLLSWLVPYLIYFFHSLKIKAKNIGEYCANHPRTLIIRHIMADGECLLEIQIEIRQNLVDELLT